MNLQLENISFTSSENGAIIMPINWLNISFPNLQRLRLQNIPISEIEEYAFSMELFSKLTYLELLNVPLKTLKTATFKGLIRLEELILTGLSLVTIEKRVLAPMSKLKTFEIDDCGEEKIGLENLFGTCRLQNLYKVSIHNCNLKDTINMKTFRRLQNVKILSLSSNQIEQIGQKSLNFDNKPKIELQSNNLTSIPIDLIRSYKDVFINLTENPWKCDCQMESIRSYMQNQTNINLDQIICNTPMEYHGMNLKDCPSLCNGTEYLDWTNESETSIGDSIKLLTKESKFTEKTETEIETEAKTVSETKIGIEINSGIENESEIKITTENESRIETETEAKIETESIELECGCSDKFRANQIIQLTKPSHNIAPITRKHDGELQINKDASTNDLILIEFEQFSANEEKSCFKHTKNMKKINYKRNFEPETLYQFCWMEKNANTIFPLDCIISSSINFESGENDAWIMEQRKSIVIIACVLSAFFAPVVGILITVTLAKLFQKKIREVENLVGVTISNDQKAIGNKEESDYATPLPPRKRVVFKEEPNCCSAEHCICYCEI